MKKDFFSYIKPSEDEFRELWNTSVFSFDANILLNFYRYKNETTNDFFELLKKLKDRIIITYQASSEYFDNRLDVISEQEKAYSEVRDAIQKQIEEPLQHQRKHPHINSDLLDEFTKVASNVKDELNNRSEEYSQRISNDDILDRIVTVFDSKVGKPFDDERLEQIYHEGDKRYNENVPPGFKDKQKGGTRQFGDLVLWYQLMEISKEQSKDLIFITDDEKEDWLYLHKGKIISPLPALQKEFNIVTGRKFYLYSAYRFIEFAGKYLNTEVKEETIEEVKNLQEESNVIVATDNPVDELLTDEMIDNYLATAIRAVEDESGWADLAPLGVYLIKYTPINYRQYGFLSLRRFIESREMFETKVIQKSPNARAVDTALVRLKEKEVN
jgi:hypothetical protein